MSQTDRNGQIDFIEFAVRDIAKTKAFFQELFGWNFEDYGPEYTCFLGGGISGGFFLSEKVETGGALIVIYAAQLEVMKQKVEAVGGTIVKDIFSFPGGRRFHFTDPSGHVLAIWSDAEPA
jgi:predicted enzyme related to lactoylglutathione lyase